MPVLWRLAFRNVWRNRRRTLITSTAISMGLAAMIVGKALMDGMDVDSRRNIINSETAHIKIFAEGYFEERSKAPLNLTITNPQVTLAALDSLPQIVGAEPRVLFGGLLIGRAGDLGCACIGFDPEGDASVFDLHDKIVAGRFVQSGEEGALVGVDLAEDFELLVGDFVTVETMMADSARNAFDLEVVGIFDTGHPGVDGGVIFLPLDVASRALNLGQQVTEIAVRLQRLEQVQKTAVQISTLLHKLGLTQRVYRWDEIAGDFLEISKMKVKSSALISLIMVIIATFGIVNTMLMATMERTKEIGTIAAIGMKRRWILLLFVLESSIIGALGSLFGCAIGAGLSLYLERFGLTISGLGEGLQEISEAVYPIKDTYYADLGWEILILTFLFGVIVSTGAGIYASWRASRLEPTEALRYV